MWRLQSHRQCDYQERRERDAVAAIARGGSGDHSNDLLQQTRLFRDLRRSFFQAGFQYLLDLGTVNAPFRPRVVDVAEPADARVTARQIHATLDVERAVVRAAGALVHVYALPESRGPLVAGLLALAAHVYLVRHECLKAPILLPVQRAVPLLYEYRRDRGLNVRSARAPEADNCARVAPRNANEHANLD